MNVSELQTCSCELCNQINIPDLSIGFVGGILFSFILFI